MKQLYDNKGTPISLLQDTDMEYGSNAYGEYFKFPNGLLIQKGALNKTINIRNKSGSLFYDDGYNVSLPKSFIDTNYYVNVSTCGNGFVFTYAYGLTSKDVFKFNLASSVEQISVSNYPISWFAIGRWK